MRGRGWLCIAAGLLLVAIKVEAAPFPGWHLERVVLLMRHGVRAPTEAPAQLRARTGRDWPQWPVAPGQLTRHGADGVRAMGDWLRQHYAALGLLPPRRCPGDALAIWADNADQRTRASGRALAAGLAPGCAARARWQAGSQHDPRFHGLKTGACPLDGAATLAQLLARAGGDPARPFPGADRALAAVAARVCGGAPRCPAMAGQDRLRLHHGVPKLHGPLATASTLGENFLLEAAQGFPAPVVAWGVTPDADSLRPLLAAHNGVDRWLRQAPVLAAHNSGLLARALLAALERGVSPATTVPARLVAFVGHDTNLSNVAALLGVGWSALAGQPDDTPPAAVLAFERWRDAGGGVRIRVRLFWPTLAQLRAPRELSHPPGRRTLSPSCADAGTRSCSLAGFSRQLRGAIDGACRGG